MKDYTEKTIYSGIGVHKKSYSVVVVCDIKWSKEIPLS